MGYLRFCWLVVRQAWSEALDQAQAVLFLCIILAGVAVTDIHHGQDFLDLLLSWKGAAFVLGSVVVARILAAPYYLWKQQKERAEALAKIIDEAAPLRLVFDHMDAMFVRKDNVGGEIGTEYWIGVHNTSAIRSVNDVKITVDKNALILFVLRERTRGREPHPGIDAQIATINPLTVEYVRLFGIIGNTSPVMYLDAASVLKGTHRLLIRVSGKDAREVVLSLLFDGQSYPSLKLDTPTGR
jgi:hypothetical protein